MPCTCDGVVVDVDLGEEVTAELSLDTGPANLNDCVGVCNACDVGHSTLWAVGLHDTVVLYPMETFHTANLTNCVKSQLHIV